MTVVLFFQGPRQWSIRLGALGGPRGCSGSFFGAQTLPVTAVQHQTRHQQQQIHRHHHQQQQTHHHQHQEQTQQHQQQRDFSRFIRHHGNAKPPSHRQTLDPKPSKKPGDHKPSTPSPKTKPLNSEAAMRQQPVSGSESLYAECVAALRRRRWELGDDLEAPSEAIEELTRREKEIINQLVERSKLDSHGSETGSGSGSGIDAFWDPMARVEGLEAQVAQDFEEFTKLVGAAEARRQRLLLRSSLKKASQHHDPLTVRDSDRQEIEAPPLPHRRSERFWNPSAELRKALKNNNLPITWKDLHLLHHFVGTNGLLLPRRLTQASRVQQRFIYKAVNTARRMGLFPYDRKPHEACNMPLMDPIQFLVDELTHRAAVHQDLRAEAMVRVLMERFPKLDFYRFLQLQARWREEGRSERPRPKSRTQFETLFKS